MGKEDKRRYFTREFKVNAVQLVTEKGLPVGKVAQELDIHPNLLHLWRTIQPGVQLFPRIEAGRSLPAVERSTEVAAGPAMQAASVTVRSFGRLQKLDLRVGRIVTAEPVPKADQLLKLTVDVGQEQRTVVAGIATSYRPEALVGKNIILVANLAPRTLRGVESQGMVLAAESDGQIVLAGFDAPVNPGITGEMIMLIDSHAHLDMPHFDADRDAVITRAQEVGVAAILTLGVDGASSQRAVALAQQYEGVFAAVGIHPHEAKHATPEDYKMLMGLARAQAANRIVAWGEIGLDYHYDHSPRDVQQREFRRQIRMARELDLPVCIHSREAHDDVLTILDEEHAIDAGVVMHCFSGMSRWPGAALTWAFTSPLQAPSLSRMPANCRPSSRSYPMSVCSSKLTPHIPPSSLAWS